MVFVAMVHGSSPGVTHTLLRVAAAVLSILVIVSAVSPTTTSVESTTESIQTSEYAGLIQQGVNLSAVMSIFAPVSNQVKNEKCRKDSHIFLRELHRFTLWATQSKYILIILL